MRKIKKSTVVTEFQAITLQFTIAFRGRLSRWSRADDRLRNEELKENPKPFFLRVNTLGAKSLRG